MRSSLERLIMNNKNPIQKITHLIPRCIIVCLCMIGRIFADDSTIDYSLFKEPPAEYRGICWMGFNLSNINENRVISSIQSNKVKDSWGTFMLGPGGGPTTGLSEAYLRGSRRTPNDRGVPYLSEEYFKIISPGNRRRD